MSRFILRVFLVTVVVLGLVIGNMFVVRFVIACPNVGVTKMDCEAHLGGVLSMVEFKGLEDCYAVTGYWTDDEEDEEDSEWVDFDEPACWGGGGEKYDINVLEFDVSNSTITSETWEKCSLLKTCGEPIVNPIYLPVVNTPIPPSYYICQPTLTENAYVSFTAGRCE